MNADRVQRTFKALPWWGWLVIAGVGGFTWWWIFVRGKTTAPADTSYTTWAGQPGFSAPTNN